MKAEKVSEGVSSVFQAFKQLTESDGDQFRVGE